MIVCHMHRTVRDHLLRLHKLAWDRGLLQPIPRGVGADPTAIARTLTVRAWIDTFLTLPPEGAIPFRLL